MARGPQQDFFNPALTAFQERFAQEFLVDLNAGEAARRAGSGAKDPKGVGHELLNNPKVRERIEQLMLERIRRTQITADDVILELSRIAFANVLDYIRVQPDGTAVVDLSRIDRAKGAAIQEVTVDALGVEKHAGQEVPVKRIKFKLADKQRALELLGRHLGMFDKRIQLNVTGRIALTDLLDGPLGDEILGDDESGFGETDAGDSNEYGS